MSQALTIVHTRPETADPRKVTQRPAQVAGSQAPDADLTTISNQANTAFGLLLLTEASAAHLLGTTLNAYTTTQTNAAITTALVPYLTSATAAATYQPLGSYVRYDAQTLTAPQQAQARTNIGAGTGSGTVTSVGLTSTDFTISGSPVTGSGSITANLAATISTAHTWSAAQVFSNVLTTFGASAGASWTGIINGAAASTRAFSYRTANVQRWQEGVDNSAEGGSNAGSSYFLGAYSDAGAFLGFAYTIDRATRTVAFPVSPTAPTPTAGDNTTKVPTTAMLVRDYQPLDGDLTSLAGASSTGALYYRSAASTWSPVIIGSGVAFAAGTLSATGSGGTVTSIGLSSTDFTVSGSPVTGAGVITANLATQAGITPASYGSASQTVTATVNSKGVLTALSAQAIAIGWSAITSGKPTTLAGYGITDAQPAGTYATGTGTASGTNTGDQTFSLTVPSIFTAGASSTSALSFTVASQAANLVWASPNGASGAPTFRSLVAADIPSLTATYEAVANKGVANGYAPLDANAKLAYANVLWRYNAGGLDATNTLRYDDATTPRGGVYNQTTALTANRTLNLSAVNALTGETWRIVRTSAGAFLLNVTDLTSTVVLKGLATNTWMDAVFNGTNWVLIGYGSL